MNNPALMGPWWLWWTNPLVQMHPDQLKRHDFATESRPTLEYAEITNLRTCLGLSILPEEGVLDGIRLGFLALAEDSDLCTGTEKLLSLTLDEEVLKIRPQEWEERFGVTDINQIRELIKLSREIPQDLQIFSRQLAQLCAPSGEELVLTFPERIRLLVLVYSEIRLPEFAKRWSLTLSDRLLKAAENLRRFQSECGDLLALQMEPTLEGLVNHIMQQHEVPEVQLSGSYPDLDSEPDFEGLVSHQQTPLKAAQDPGNQAAQNLGRTSNLLQSSRGQRA